MCWYCLYWESCPLPSDQSCLVRKSTELVNISMYIWNWKYSLQQSTINNQIRFDENSLVPNNDGTYKHTCSYSFIGRDIPCKANMTIPRTRHLKMLSVKIQNQELYPLIWFALLLTLDVSGGSKVSKYGGPFFNTAQPYINGWEWLHTSNQNIKLCVGMVNCCYCSHGQYLWISLPIHKPLTSSIYDVMMLWCNSNTQKHSWPLETNPV